MGRRRRGRWSISVSMQESNGPRDIGKRGRPATSGIRMRWRRWRDRYGFADSRGPGRFCTFAPEGPRGDALFPLLAHSVVATSAVFSGEELASFATNTARRLARIGRGSRRRPKRLECRGDGMKSTIQRTMATAQFSARRSTGSPRRLQESVGSFDSTKTSDEGLPRRIDDGKIDLPDLVQA